MQNGFIDRLSFRAHAAGHVDIEENVNGPVFFQTFKPGDSLFFVTGVKGETVFRQTADTVVRAVSDIDNQLNFA